MMMMISLFLSLRLGQDAKENIGWVLLERTSANERSGNEKDE